MLSATRKSGIIAQIIFLMKQPIPFEYSNNKGYVTAVLFGTTPELLDIYKDKIETAKNWGLYKPATDAWGDDIYVEPDYRQNGAGRELFEELLTFCVANQVRRMVGHFSPSLDNQQPKETTAWYSRLGFTLHQKKGLCFVTKDL